MGEQTGIVWTHHTFNPWWGCTKVSPACDHCYAERDARRYGFSDLWGGDAGRRELSEAYWREPLKWNRKAEKAGFPQRRVFCGSMCDVMEDGVWLQARRERLYETIQNTPWLTWLLLTKRPQNFRKYLPAEWLDRQRLNVWLLTTVERQEYLWRAAELTQLPAAVRGLSLEPLLGAINLRRCEMKHPILGPVLVNLLTGEMFSYDGASCGRTGAIKWVITGAETGPGARISHPEWFRSVRSQCQAAGVAYCHKQNGEWIEVNGDHPTVQHDVAEEPLPAGPREAFISLDGHVIYSEREMRHDVAYRWMRRIGRKDAGRLMDGREWVEFPEVKRAA